VNATAIEPVQKKPYAPPRLVAYGAVSKLTQNGTGSGADGVGNSMIYMCL